MNKEQWITAIQDDIIMIGLFCYSVRFGSKRIILHTAIIGCMLYFGIIKVYYTSVPIYP